MRFQYFKDFLVNEEKLGFSEASLLLFSPLEMRTSASFRDFIKSDANRFSKTEIINYRTLRPFIDRSKLNVYSKFPVVKFELDLDFRKISDKEWSKK